MKRPAVLALAFVLVCAVPARAEVVPNHDGTVSLPVLTPQVARVAYAAGVPNRVVADVFKLPVAADGRMYTLKLTGGATGFENPDVYFYQGTDTTIGDICTTDAHESDPKTETGTICPRAQDHVAWAVVVLRAGAQASFTLSVA